MNRAAAILALAAALLLPAGAAMAENKCFTVVNRTMDTLKAFSKVGDRTYCLVEPLTEKKCCCDTMFERLCFNKAGKTSKVKIVRVAPDTGAEYSGTGCRKIYASPDMRFSVSYDLDRVHLSCRILDPGEKVPPMPDFDDADLDKDGVLDEKEAMRVKVDPSKYGKSITREQYNSMFGFHF